MIPPQGMPAAGTTTDPTAGATSQFTKDELLRDCVLQRALAFCYTHPKYAEDLPALISMMDRYLRTGEVIKKETAKVLGLVPRTETDGAA